MVQKTKKKKKTDPLEDLITSGEIKLSQQSFHSHLISYQRQIEEKMG